MKKLILVLMLSMLSLNVHAQIDPTNTFSVGQIITASGMNTNFVDLGASALNRASGGNITGNITVAGGITIDGADVGAYLATNVYAQDNGDAAGPSFTWVGDTDNGMFLGGTNIVDFATGGTARVRIAADGTVAINSTSASALDVAGGLNIGSGNVALVDATGQITSLDTEYLVDLSAEDLTTLNASALASGTVPTARLGSGTASSGTFLRGDGSWQSVGSGVAGSDTQVQYNNGGSLGGDSGFTFDDNTKSITIAGNLAASAISASSTAANSLDIGGGLNAGSGNVSLIGTDGKLEGPLSSTIIDNLSGANLTALDPKAVTNSDVTFDSGSATIADNGTETISGNIGNYILFVLTGEPDERNMNIAFVDTANQDIILHHTSEGGSVRWSTSSGGSDMWNLYFSSNSLILQNTRDDCGGGCTADWFLIKAS